MNRGLVIVGLLASVWLCIIMNNFLGFALSCAVFAVSIFLAHRQSCLSKVQYKIAIIRQWLSRFSTRGSFKAYPVTDRLSSAISRPILDLPPFQRIQNFLEDKIAKGVRSSGIPLNPLNAAKRSISLSLLCAFIAIPSGVMLGFLSNIVFFSFLAMPIGIVFYPRLVLFLARTKREGEIRDELAYFVRYAGIMQSVERGLYDSLVGLIGCRLFEIIETEAKMAYRNVAVFAMDHLEVLNEAALYHPNRIFRSFLLSYVATAQTGGDLTNLLETEADRLFESLKASIKRYTETSSNFGEVLLIVLLIMPTFLIATSFLLPTGSVTLMVLIGIVVIPLTSLGLVVLVDSSQPRNKDRITMNRFAIVAGVIISLVFTLLQVHPWLSVTAGVMGFSLVNLLHTRPQFLLIKNVEGALPEFLRDVTEYRKIGYDMTISLFHIFGRRRYNRDFDKILGAIFARLRSGQDLSSIRIEENRSWMTRLIFFILAKIAETGGGTPLALEHLTRFVSDIAVTKRETASVLRTQMYLAYAGPLLMVWVAKVSTSLLTKMSSDLAFFSSSISNTFSVTPGFSEAVNLVIVVSSISMGFVFTKISTFTLKDTRGVAMTTVLVLAAMLLYPYLPSIF